MLRRSGLRDLELSTVACKAMYNSHLQLAGGTTADREDNEATQVRVRKKGCVVIRATDIRKGESGGYMAVHLLAP